MATSRSDRAVLAGCIAVASSFAWLVRDIRNDDAYVTYRYAQNLLAGRGFVFNPGEPVLATTAPGHGLLVAMGGLVSPDLVSVALVLSTIAAVALAWCAYLILRDANERVAGVLLAGTILFSPSTYDLFPLETLVVSALVLWGVRLAQEQRPIALGLVAGLAATIRADALAALAAILVIALWRRANRPKWIRSLAAAALAAAPWLVYAAVAYGHPLPSTAATKTGWPGHTWTYAGKLWERGLVPLFGVEAVTWIALPFAAVGLFAIVREPRFAPLRALPLWMALHVLAYTALRILWPHHWYYHPVTLTFALCTGVGAVTVARWVARRSPLGPRPAKLARAGLGAVVVSLWCGSTLEQVELRERIPTEFFLGGRDALYRDAAAWLCRHSRPTDRVALAEPGTLAYHCDRPVLDMMGLVTPEIGEAMKQRRAPVDVPWMVDRFAPEYFVLIPLKPAAVARRLPDAPDYVLVAAFEREGVDRRVLVYGRDAT